MDRRAFVFASLALAAAPTSAGAAAPIEVIYVGGWDCPYCTVWKNQYKADWLASPDYRRVKFVEVESPNLREAYQDRFWPGELRDVLAQIPHKNGTPRFLIVKGGKLVSNEYGIGNGWNTTLKHLHKLLG